ncbi:DUF6587 family protein [Burkholderia sp. WAC0059]|uniref:DUF6587 family protein n=1 Tax=Burkholderia sp. WAC0059 TaxID=2066022 RepID=UPI0015E14B94|nr:DUF6587 family protein [Burkholderia sp. WAC0059]
MNTGLYLQYAVIVLLVAASSVYLFRRLAPRAAARWQTSAAASLAKTRRPRAVRALGRWLEPRAAASGDCDSGCGGCSGCGKAEAPSAAEDQDVLQFRPPRK